MLRPLVLLQEAFKRLGLSIMGTTSSKLEKSLPSSFPDSERLFGLENVSCAAARAPPAPSKKEGASINTFVAPAQRSPSIAAAAAAVAACPLALSCCVCARVANRWGLRQFGNTCYCNSVLQSLYFCIPFREAVLEWYRTPNPHSKVKNDEDSMLMSVAECFQYINSHKKKFGVYAPKKLIQTLKKKNEAFRGFQHQDAHEFMNYFLNQIGEELHREVSPCAVPAGVGWR